MVSTPRPGSHAVTADAAPPRSIVLASPASVCPVPGTDMGRLGVPRSGCAPRGLGIGPQCRPLVLSQSLVSSWNHVRFHCLIHTLLRGWQERASRQGLAAEIRVGASQVSPLSPLLTSGAWSGPSMLGWGSWASPHAPATATGKGRREAGAAVRPSLALQPWREGE